MINVISKKRTKFYIKCTNKKKIQKQCLFKGCSINPSFNYITEKKRLYCKKHAKKDMVNIKLKKCLEIGCNILPTFNFTGEHTAIYCKKHKKTNMINIKHKHCNENNCYSRSSYGIPGNKPIYCAKHKQDNMISNPTHRCENKNCKEIAIYGYKKAIYCEDHKFDDMVNFIEHECLSCGLTNILNKNNVCTYCDPSHFNTFRGAKEREVKSWLNINNYTIFQHDSMIDKGECIRNRPDFILEAPNNTHYVIIEVDEHQHENYEELCECTRMINITQSLGGKPVIFIRYNPDEFKFNKRKRNPNHNTRMKTLKKWLDWTLNKEFDDFIKLGLCSMVRLYYDGYDEAKVNYKTLLNFEKEDL